MSLTQDQLEFRRTGITATDTVVLAGESGYRSPLDVYLDKVGQSEPWSGNAATRIGEQLEPLAMALLAEDRGLILTQGETERHPTIAHEIATPDRNVVDARGARVAVAEAKVVGFRMAGKWGAVPSDSVVIQCTKQMLVTTTRKAYVSALFGTEPRFYELELDDRDLGPALLELDEAFWKDHVLARVPPAPDATEASARALRQLYPRVKGGIVRASTEIEQVAREYFEAAKLAKEAEGRLLGAENALKAAIGSAEAIDGDGWAARWSERKGSVSWKSVVDKMLASTPASAFEPFRGKPSRVFDCKPSVTKGIDR